VLNLPFSLFSKHCHDSGLPSPAPSPPIEPGPCPEVRLGRAIPLRSQSRRLSHGPLALVFCQNNVTLAERRPTATLGRHQRRQVLVASAVHDARPSDASHGLRPFLMIIAPTPRYLSLPSPGGLSPGVSPLLDVSTFAYFPSASRNAAPDLLLIASRCSCKHDRLPSRPQATTAAAPRLQPAPQLPA
jgi:hypothetical protein